MAKNEVRATIANEMSRLQSEYYGRGPLKAKTYVTGDLVAVVLEETFTPAEKTLIDRGHAEGVKDIRRTFQQAMREQFASIVEQATGRHVRAFFSDTDIDTDVSVGVFLLADEPTIMSALEADEEA